MKSASTAAPVNPIPFMKSTDYVLAMQRRVERRVDGRGGARRTGAAASAKVAARRRAPYLALVSEPQIILTENAAKRVAWIAERQSKPAILRLAVDGGGCAGFTYKFELAEAADADDAVAETDGVKLVVDPVSLDLVAARRSISSRISAARRSRSPIPTRSPAAAADRASRSSRDR